jgi:hypothetical protein
MIFVERQLALEATPQEDGLRESAKPKGTKATMLLKRKHRPNALFGMTTYSVAKTSAIGWA